MKRILFLSTLLISNFANAGLDLNYRAYDTPVNYNFAEIQVSHQTYELDGYEDIDTNLVTISSEFMLNENVIMGYSFAGEDINDSVTLLNGSAMLLYRLLLIEEIDFVFGGELELDWVALEDISGDTHYEHENTAFGAHLGLRYGFSDKLEGITQVVIFDSSSVSVATEVNVKLSYYITEQFGFGVSYLARFNDGLSYLPGARDDIDRSNFGAHIRFRF